MRGTCDPLIAFLRFPGRVTDDDASSANLSSMILAGSRDHESESSCSCQSIKSGGSSSSIGRRVRDSSVIDLLTSRCRLSPTHDSRSTHSLTHARLRKCVPIFNVHVCQA